MGKQCWFLNLYLITHAQNITDSSTEVLAQYCPLAQLNRECCPGVLCVSSEDYLASSSAVSPLSVLPSDASDKAPFRNHLKLLIIKRDAGSSFPIPLPLLCQRISGSSLFPSQMRVTLPYLSKEEVFPWTSQVQGRGMQNSFTLSPDPKLFLFWLFLAGYLIACWLLYGKPGSFSATLGPLLAVAPILVQSQVLSFRFALSKVFTED